MQRVFWLIGLLTLLLAGCSRQQGIADYLPTADSLLWANPDSCLRYIESCSPELNYHDRQVEALIREHAIMKVQYGLEDDSLLFVLKEYFESIDDYRYAGEANYIIGRNLVAQLNYPLATFYLKSAEENLLKASDNKPILLGSIYFNLGSCAFNDRLFEVANEYYKLALPYYIESGDSLYISCAYRDIAKSSPFNLQQTLELIDSSLQFLPIGISPIYRLEIEKTKYDMILHIGEREVLPIYHALCDSLQEFSYANELCDYYLSEHDLKQAYHYLTLSALDTANSYWSLEHYLFNKATYLSEIGLKDSAIAVLQDLHLRQTAEIESSAFTRSYMVEQRYDAERERLERVQETVRKQRAYMWVGLSALAILILLALAYWQHKQNSYRLQLSQQHNQLLQQELESRRELFRLRLSERLSVAKELHQWAVANSETMPDALNLLSPQVAGRDADNWQVFLSDFDLCYDNLLSRLQQEHPALTETDLQYIALSFLGFDVNDICILLHQAKRTIWNRRASVKEHLSSPVDDLDQWIHSFHS